MRNLFQAAWLAVAACLFSSCGGSDSVPSASDAGGPGGGALSESGKVVVLLADGPADDYDHLWAEIREISLLSASSKHDDVTLFEADKKEDGVTVDLLDLRDEDFVLTSRDVAPGTYSKIRLRLGEVRPEGGPCDDLDIKIPSGKIDLHPQGDFQVVRGQSLSIRLDIDVNKSIQLKKAGRSGKCIFRPVIFVDIEPGAPVARCSRSVEGTITRVIKDSDDDDDDDEDEDEIEGLVLALGNRRGDIRVNIDENTTAFGTDGRPMSLSELKVDQLVNVRGRVDSKGELEALVIVRGGVLALEGVVVSDFEDGTFELEPEENAPVNGTIDVDVFEETLVLAGCDDPVSADEIRNGGEVRVLGKFDASEGLFRAVLVHVSRNKIRASITELETVPGGVRLALHEDSDDEASDYILPRDVKVFLEGAGEVSLDLLSSLVECRPIPVVACVEDEDSRRVSALQVTADSITGEVTEVDAADRRIELVNGELAIPEGATIVDVRDEQSLIDLADIPTGVEIHAFGVSGCDEDDDFTAFVILVQELDDDEIALE